MVQFLMDKLYITMLQKLVQQILVLVVVVEVNTVLVVLLFQPVMVGLV